MTREVLPQKSPPPEAAGLAPTLQEVNGETQPQVCICFAGRNEIHAPFACNMCCPNLEKKKMFCTKINSCFSFRSTNLSAREQGRPSGERRFW